MVIYHLSFFYILIKIFLNYYLKDSNKILLNYKNLHIPHDQLHYVIIVYISLLNKVLNLKF